MAVFEYYVPPKEITAAQDLVAFADQAKEAEAGQATGIVVSTAWTVTINGIGIPVLATPVTFRGPHHFCQVRYTVEPCPLTFFVRNRDHRSLRVRAKDCFIPSVPKDGGIEFTYAGEGQLTLEADGIPDAPLSIFVSARETEPPERGDPDIIWFGPGLHLVQRLELRDGQTVYLENGALLRAIPPEPSETPVIEDDWAHVPEYTDFITAFGKKKITIRGMGIIETTQLPWHARRTIYLEDCEDIRIEGILAVGPAHWTVVPYHCERVRIHDVKVFGYRTNSDGIDLVNCKDVSVSGCYLRTGDDAVCLKGMLSPDVPGGENVRVCDCTIWTEKARSLGIIGETRGDFQNIVFENCLVLHGYANWTRELGALCIVLSDGGTVRDVVFRNIEIIQEASWVIDCMIRPDFWSTDQKPGHIQDILFENIRVPQDARINLEGFDPGHLVEKIGLNCVTNEHGEELLTIQKNNFARMITFR